MRRRAGHDGTLGLEPSITNEDFRSDCRALRHVLQGTDDLCYCTGVTQARSKPDRARKRHHPIEFTTFRLMRNVEGISLFFAFFMLLVAALYWIGNYQDFVTESQHMLLEIVELAGLLCALTSGYYLILLSAWMIRRRFLVLPRIIYAISAIVLGLLFASASSFLTVLFSYAG